MKYLLSLSILLFTGCSTLCTHIIGASYNGPDQEVDHVFHKSPADIAGIREGDLLVAKYNLGTSWIILRPNRIDIKKEDRVYHYMRFQITPVCPSEIEDMKPVTWEDTAKGYDGSKK